MIPDSLDFILRSVDEQQAEYAAAHKTAEVPNGLGEAEARSCALAAGEGDPAGYRAPSHSQTSATPALSPRGVADTNSPAADVEGAPASGAQASAAEHSQERFPSGPVRSAAEGFRWAPVDSDTADLLDLLAETNTALPESERQWNSFVGYLAWTARHNGLIDQNAMRPLLRGDVSPSRVGPFYRRACREGLIRPEGSTTSNDKHGRNSGKPTRSFRWLGP